MAAAVSTLIFLPLSSSPNSGAAVTDTHTSARVTAAVVPEHLHAAVSERANVSSVGRVTALPMSSRVKLEGQVSSAFTRSETCRSARRGTAFYRQRQRDWLKLRGVETTARAPNGGLSNRSAGTRETPRKPRNCADARYLAQVAKRRSFAARQEYGRWLERRTWDVNIAINYVFGPYAGQAHRVVSCESGHSTTAANGQYLGLFQMGSSERATYGHGPSPLEQARAAHRYFVASGRDWSPWSCKP